MLNPVFEKLYCPKAVEGLKYLAAKLEEKGINGLVFGVNRHVNGYIGPEAFLMNEDDTEDNDILVLVVDAEDIMTKSIKEDIRVKEYGVFNLVCPKCVCDQVIDGRDDEVRNVLWV